VYRIIQCKKSHTTGENLIPSAPTDNAKQLSVSLCLKARGMTAYKKKVHVLGCLLCSSLVNAVLLNLQNFHIHTIIQSLKISSTVIIFEQVFLSWH